MRECLNARMRECLNGRILEWKNPTMRNTTGIHHFQLSIFNFQFFKDGEDLLRFGCLPAARCNVLHSSKPIISQLMRNLIATTKFHVKHFHSHQAYFREFRYSVGTFILRASLASNLVKFLTLS